MYYRRLETDAFAKAAHNANQKRNATDRLKAVAAKKRAKRGK